MSEKSTGALIEYKTLSDIQELITGNQELLCMDNVALETARIRPIFTNLQSTIAGLGTGREINSRVRDHIMPVTRAGVTLVDVMTALTTIRKRLAVLEKSLVRHGGNPAFVQAASYDADGQGELNDQSGLRETPAVTPAERKEIAQRCFIEATKNSLYELRSQITNHWTKCKSLRQSLTSKRQTNNTVGANDVTRLMKSIRTQVDHVLAFVARFNALYDAATKDGPSSLIRPRAAIAVGMLPQFSRIDGRLLLKDETTTLPWETTVTIDLKKRLVENVSRCMWWPVLFTCTIQLFSESVSKL